MSDPRVIQPLVIMAEPTPAPEHPDDDRFIEDTSVQSGLTFEEWIAARRPPPTPEPELDLSKDIPEP